MIGRPRAGAVPVKFPLDPLDREIVDAGDAPLHEAVVGEFPILIAVGTKPVAELSCHS